MEAGEPSAAYQDGQSASKKYVKEAVDILMNAMAEKFDNDQKQPNRYVVAYYDKDNNLLGYHADSFCNLTQNKEKGKRYHGDNPYKQLEVIRKNLDFTLSQTEDTANKGLFGDLASITKKKYYANMSKEDVFIEAVYLEEGIPPQRFVWREITE